MVGLLKIGETPSGAHTWISTNYAQPTILETDRLSLRTGPSCLVQRARALPRPERQALIDGEAKMPITTQCQLLGLSRSSVYYRAREVSGCDLALMRLLTNCI